MMIALKRWLPWQSYNEVFVSLVYFVQGSAGLTGIAASLILREQMGLDFLQMGMIAMATTLPWSIKPLFGLLTDLLPIGKFRRRPYLHIGPLIAFLGYLLVSFYGHDFQTFFLALLFANIGLSLTDVATDGFVVEESTPENAARIQGLTQASIRLAAFVTSFFSGLLIFAEILSPHQMYLLLALFPLMTFAASFFLKERSVADWTLMEPAPADSLSLETTLEQKRTQRFDLEVFSPGFVSTLIVIFALIISNIVFSSPLDEWFANHLPSLSRAYLTTALWLLFGVWMVKYFRKLIRLKMASSMIFIALLFILLWRINPGAGNSTFFYVKDVLGIDERTIGFVNTTSHVGSLLGVIAAVKIFDRIRLKSLLLGTVILAAVYGFTGFAVTRPEWGSWIGGAPVISSLAGVIAWPVYFGESLFSWLIAGSEWSSPFASVAGLSGMERFLFLNSLVEEMVVMVAYIPLLKFAVLITPKRAEATNFAIITSVMNVGLALSSWLSGFLYNVLMGRMHPELPVTDIRVDVIELLIWVNIITTVTCLLVLPWLKTEEYAPDEA